MTPDQFVRSAIRTESKIPAVNLNTDVFNDLVSALIDIGTILDQVKKNVFYQKPFKIEEIQYCVRNALESLENVDTSIHNQEFPNPTFNTDATINPRIFHSVVGIATEAVELLEAIDVHSNNYDKVNLLEEFGDLAWYQAIGINEANGSFEEVLEKVIAKLRVRFPDKFTCENAIYRDLTAERQVLEENND